jgi:hypothetical protein
LATQRITIAKIGGSAADLVLVRLREWSASRTDSDPSEWSSDQWPPSVRIAADVFADRLRANSLYLPIVYFFEWVDQWSMGDIFKRWLTPPDGKPPLAVFADRHQVFGYPLPDGSCLVRHLTTCGPQQFGEYDEYVDRLLGAVRTWDTVVERSALVVLREVVGGLVTDDELRESLPEVPN